MKKIRRNLTALLMAGCLAVSGAFAVPAPAAAAEENSQAGILTRVTKEVKEKLTIPKKLTEFNYNLYEEYGSRPRWYLSWSDKKDSNSIRVVADSQGRIYEYDLSMEHNGHYIPRYGRSALKKKAEAFIQKVSPGIKNKLSFQKAEYQGVYSGLYCFTWERKENGTRLPQNTVKVSVNCESGEIMEYSAQYSYGLSIPQGAASVTKKAAKDKIKGAMKMQLKYFSGVRYNKKWAESVKAFLAYVPEYPYIAVDAISGEVYTPDKDSFFDENGSVFNKETAVQDSGSGREAGLTEQEIYSIEGISGIISAKEARTAVENAEALLFHEGMTRVATKLYQRSAGAGYVWKLSFETPEGDDGEEQTSHYAEAEVDAKTGRILSYYTDYNYDGKTKKLVSVEEGRSRLEAFAQVQVPQYYNSVRFSEQSDEGDRGYCYEYQRFYKDIPYSGNVLSGWVEPAEGKICRFSISWDYPDSFESPNKVIGAKKAADLYLALDGFEKVYEIDNPTGESPSARLVYHTNINPAYISALTGKQVTWNGEEYKPFREAYRYSDIKGNPSEDNIWLLADMGIGFEGGKFKPNQAITKAELKTFFERLDYVRNRYVDALKGKGTITRLEAAKLSFQALGMQRMAELKNIYSIDFSDKNKIAEKDWGYAALAEGLGLLSTDKGKRLRPDQKLTRAEAADMLVAVMALR